MKLVRIATPCYYGNAKFRYALGIAQMVQDLGVVESPFRLRDIDGADGPLVTNRNVLYTRALATEGLDVLLWVDSDCAPLYADPQVLYRFLGELQGDVAVVAAKCAIKRYAMATAPIGVNVVPFEKELSPREQWSAYDVRAVGMGFTAWNMRWWRSAMARNGWHPVDEAIHFFEQRGGVGEDYRACEFVRDLGGRILVDPCMGSIHDGHVVEPLVRKVVLQ